jgi:hypothetical protein
MCIDSVVVVAASSPLLGVHRSLRSDWRRETDLEDIGDGDSVLGGLALGGNDGNGRPRHDGYRGMLLC